MRGGHLSGLCRGELHSVGMVHHSRPQNRPASAASPTGHGSRYTRPVYGLSRAGRAVAAASTEADNSSYRLTGHGICVKNLGQGAELHDLFVADEGKGSFTQLAPLLRSGTLPVGAPLDKIWSSIPGLFEQPIGHGSLFPPLRLEPHSMQGLDGTRREIQAWVHGLPRYLRNAADPGQAAADFLGFYPALATSAQSSLIPEAFTFDDWQPGVTLRCMRCWPWNGPVDGISVLRFLKVFGDSRALPYLGDDDRWVFPRSVFGSAEESATSSRPDRRIRRLSRPGPSHALSQSYSSSGPQSRNHMRVIVNVTR